MFLAATALAGCSAILGLRDIDEGAVTPANDASLDVREDGNGEVPEAGADAATDTGTDAGNDGSVCNGALLCDDFENQAISSKWMGGNTTTGGEKKVGNRSPQTATNKYWFVVGYSNVPAAGESHVDFQYPAGGARRSIRFTLDIPDDSYDQDLPVVSLQDSGGNGVRVVVHTSPYTLTAKTGTASTTAIPVAANTPFCVVLSVDPLSGAISLTKDSTTVNVTDLARVQNANIAQLGIKWAGADANSKQMHYDDVVIANTSLGCP